MSRLSASRYARLPRELTAPAGIMTPEMIRGLLALLLLACQPLAAADTEQWGVFEAELKGPAAGNPYLEVELSAVFTHGGRETTVAGFYDGDGLYRLRFMPDATGEWSYRTTSNRPELDGRTGTFTCVKPPPTVHGPVVVRDQFHFAYADGTPYFPFGTTAYAWVHQGDELEGQTLETLRGSGFNKIRMCIFPKDYVYNRNEPLFHPYERRGDGKWIFDRFDPAFWHHLEKRIAQLAEIGVEADLILWHPYDRWRHSHMTPEQDVRYLRYAIARLAAYRNVWWSLANEYDFMLERKPMTLWDRFFQILQGEDPHHHLRSIHNGNVEKLYDHTRPWVTHASLQHSEVRKIKEWRKEFGKPVVNDECEYEGNIPSPWGNISARELVHRVWILVANGGYTSHGETYENKDDILWWSKGGILRGESWKRLQFLRGLVEERPGGFTPFEGGWIWSRIYGGHRPGESLYYLGPHQPLAWDRGLPKKGRYMVDVIDTWEMTVETLPGPFTAPFKVPLPGKPYMAFRLRAAE